MCVCVRACACMFRCVITFYAFYVILLLFIYFTASSDDGHNRRRELYFTDIMHILFMFSPIHDIVVYIVE